MATKSPLFPLAMIVAAGACLLAQGAAPVQAGRAQTSGRSTPPASTAAALTQLQRWERATDAWNAGKYPDALRDLKAISQSPAAAEYHDRIALLTGELFTTTD